MVEGHVIHMNKEAALNLQVWHSPHIVPLAALIVDEGGMLRGQLYVSAGIPIDTLSSVSWQMLRDVLAGLRDIAEASVLDESNGVSIPASYGDVFARNVLVQDGRARLTDAGNKGNDYEGDMAASATLFASMEEKMTTKEDKARLANILELLAQTDLAFRQIVETLSVE